MSTLWLKIAGLAIVIVGVIILISVFTGSETKTAQKVESKPNTFYDQAQKDKEKFLSKPQPIDEIASDNQRTKKQTIAQPETTLVEQKVTPKPAQPKILYFKPLSEIDKIEAERLLNVAVPGRSIGRLPMTGYNLMVDGCRQIIKRWPDSMYAFKAKQLLADLPPRYQQRYSVTKKELDISRFTKSRPGTKPYTVQEN